MYNGMRVIDAHVHYALPVSAETIAEIMQKTGTDAANLVLVPDRSRVSAVPDALMAKHKFPNLFYVFASFDVSEYFVHPKTLGRHFAKYVERMRRAGCDGLKIIEGKPAMRKMLPVPDFDAQCWEPFWAYAESTQLPILWHVNDPETFWDPDRVPSWAKAQGWFYGDYIINNEAQYTQVFNVLKRYPKLRIVFAHFFFMSAQLPRLQRILDECPNVSVDLTPGTEMYINFSADPDAVGAFFEKNQDRIIYGTDIGARNVLGAGGDPGVPESSSRSQLVRSFLSENGSYTVKGDGNFLIGYNDFQLNAPGFEKPLQQKIFADNFSAFVGGRASVSPRLVIKECKRLRRVLKIMSLFDRELKPNVQPLDEVTAYFEQCSD